MARLDDNEPASGNSGSAVVLQVFVFRDGEFAGTELFSDRRIAVGRDPSAAQLVLESDSISRVHAVLEHDGHQVTIRDVQSTNGITVNRQKVEQATLGRLDEAQLGEFTIKVKLVGYEPMRFADLPPTAVGPVPVVRAGLDVADPLPAEERTTQQKAQVPPVDERPTELDAPPPSGRPLALDEWDDTSVEVSRPQAVAEFREAATPLGKEEFGAVLAGLGIARPAATVAVAPSPFGRAPAAGATLDEERETHAARAAARGQAPTEEAETLGAFGQSATAVDGPPAAPAVGEGDEDDDEADQPYVPSYSLVAQLLQERGAVALERGRQTRVEALTFLGETVVDARLLGPGESFWIGPEVGFLLRRRARDLPPRVRLVKVLRAGECRVVLHQQLRGTLERGKERLELSAVGQASKRGQRGTTMMGFRVGEVLDIVDGTARYHFRFVNPPPPTPAEPVWQRLRPTGLTLKSIGGSVSIHLVGLIALGLLVPRDFTPSTLQANDDFVEVKVEAAPELEAPPEEKPKEEEKAANEKVPANTEAKPSRKKPKPGGTSAAPAGVLGLLSKRGSSAAPGPAAAVAAVSNLTAARVPGASGGYRVSGLIGKLPTSSLSVGGGGGGLMTKGGATLLRGGAGGGGLARGAGTRGVGGLVQKNPGAMRSVGQGSLDRDEIQKVINQNIHQIQRCYERELLEKPGLSGKVQVEWTIAVTGKVRSARQTYTSMQSTEVANCIMGAIRTWTFPQPKGGEVIVNYPFIFKSIGF